MTLREDMRDAVWDAEDDQNTRLRTLLEQGVDPSLRDEPSGYAARHYITIGTMGAELIALLPGRVALLVAHGADVHARADVMYGSGWMPLHLAVWEGNTGVVVALLRGGADPEATTDDGSTPFELAVRGPDVRSVQLLLDAGVDWRRPIDGKSALEVARARLSGWRAYAAEQGDSRPPDIAASVERTCAAIVATLECLAR
jgi:hypothetical protein